MNAQKKNLEKYAHEYYLMGNECITKAHDVRAALANYDKALELYPEYTDAWVRKGVTLFDDDRISEAEECLNQAVALRPQNSSRSIIAASFACTPVTPKEPCAILTRQLLQTPPCRSTRMFR